MDDDSKLYSLPLRPDRPDELDLCPRALTRWLEALPLANLGWTSGSVYEALRRANLSPPRPAERLAFLEALRPTFCYVILRLRKLYAFREFPPPARQLEIRDFVLALLEEAARHYRGVADGLAAQRRLGDRRTLALALQRTLRCQSGRLIEHYRFYEPAPPGLWRDLHGLYREARELGVLHRAVPDDGLTGRGPCSVNRAYKQILLLAALEPARLRHQELDPIFGALKKLAATTTLHAARPGPVPRHSFLVQPHDLGPTRAGSTSHLPAETLWLDCVRLLAPSGRAARGWLAARRRPTVPAALAARIREGLMRSPQPRDSRDAAQGSLDAVIGLGAIQRLLMRRPEPTETLAVPEVDQGRWEYDPLQGQWRQASAQALEPEAESEPEAAEPTRTLQLLNQSERGYSFLLPAGEPARLRLGDALAVRQPGCAEHEPWRIGLLRWLQGEPQGLRFGVEMLEALAAPALALTADARPEDHPFRTLLLTEAAQPKGVRRSLLLPHLKLAPGDRLQVWEGETEREVLLGKELESLGACQRFEFRPAENNLPATGKPAAAAEAAGFRRLYSVL